MIEEKLQKCRVELQNMKLKKSGENKFAKFKYFELSDILPAINKMFAEYKMFSNFSICGDIATLTITDCEDKSFQTFTSNIADAEVKGCTAIQSLGAVHTYLKRYLYLNALEIIENDFLDNMTGSKDFLPEKKQTEKKNDTQIYINLAKLKNPEDVKLFYEENKEQVNDRKKFHEMAQNKINALREILNKQES